MISFFPRFMHHRPVYGFFRHLHVDVSGPLMEPHSHTWEPPPPLQHLGVRVILLLFCYSTCICSWRFFDLHLVPETCRGSIISLATVALLAIDISTPDVSVSPPHAAPPWKPPPWEYQEKETYRRPPWPDTTRVASAIRYSLFDSLLIPVSSSSGYPPPPRLRILSHLYPPNLTRRDRFFNQLFFVQHTYSDIPS